MFIACEGTFTLCWRASGDEGQAVLEEGDLICSPTWMVRGFSNSEWLRVPAGQRSAPFLLDETAVRVHAQGFAASGVQFRFRPLADGHGRVGRVVATGRLRAAVRQRR